MNSQPTSRRGRRRAPVQLQQNARRRALSTLVLAGFVAAGATAPAQAVGGYHTSYSSVRVRAQATTQSAQINVIAAAGTEIDITCQVMGETVDALGYRSAVWDKLAGYNGYVSDLFVRETRYAVFDPRIPRCDAPVSTPTPAPASGTGRARGRTEPSNSGIAGQCTWGAKQKFKDSTGVYPAVYGNAKDWKASARAAGWTVVDDAEARSIVVFQPGVQGADRTWGHVAWVDSVEIRSGARYVRLTEMNGAAGPGRWSQRVVKDVAGMSYILAT
jgi:surface antigen